MSEAREQRRRRLSFMRQKRLFSQGIVFCFAKLIFTYFGIVQMKKTKR